MKILSCWYQSQISFHTVQCMWIISTADSNFHIEAISDPIKTGCYGRHPSLQRNISEMLFYFFYMFILCYGIVIFCYTDACIRNNKLGQPEQLLPVPQCSVYISYILTEALSPYHLFCALVQSFVINHLEVDISWLSQNEGRIRSIAVLILDA